MFLCVLLGCGWLNFTSAMAHPLPPSCSKIPTSVVAEFPNNCLQPTPNGGGISLHPFPYLGSFLRIRSGRVRFRIRLHRPQ